MRISNEFALTIRYAGSGQMEKNVLEEVMKMAVPMA